MAVGTAEDANAAEVNFNWLAAALRNLSWLLWSPGVLKRTRH